MNWTDIGPLDWSHLDAKNLWYNQDAASQKSFEKNFKGTQVLQIDLSNQENS